MKPIVALPDKLEMLAGNRVDGFYLLRQGRTRQKPPFDEPTYYKMVHVRNVDIELSGGLTLGQAPFFDCSESVQPWQYRACYDTPAWVQSYIDEAVNSARAKFLDALSDRSEWLVNLAELKQAEKMITTRALQLYGLAKDVRAFFRRGKPSAEKVRKRIIKLRRERGQPPKVPKDFDWRQALRDPAGLWLEIHFGWEPLVKDIHAAIKVLSEPFPDKFINVKGSTIQISSDFSSPAAITRGRAKGKVRAKVGARVRVTNPNAFLAAQLGLINPATVLWEVIPFSFVIDWFSSVGQWLAQWTDLVGCEVDLPWYSTFMSMDCEFSYKERWYPYPGCTHRSSGRYLQRYNSLPGVTLGIKSRAFRGISLIRGATAISLLIQQGLQPMRSH